MPREEVAIRVALRSEKRRKEEAENEKWTEKRDRNGRDSRRRAEGNFINNESNETGSHRERYVLVIIPNCATEIRRDRIDREQQLFIMKKRDGARARDRQFQI